MADATIKELRDLHNKTTVGCWAVVTHNKISTMLSLILGEGNPPEVKSVGGVIPRSDADMLFIATAHNAMIGLLDEVQRLRTEGLHTWVDGPDGSGYHCDRCGISKCDDHGAYRTCVSWLARGNDGDRYRVIEGLNLLEKYQRAHGE